MWPDTELLVRTACIIVIATPFFVMVRASLEERRQQQADREYEAELRRLRTPRPEVFVNTAVETLEERRGPR